MKTKASNQQGILLIAAGHNHYGAMAAALAATLRLADDRINIHLAYTDSAIAHLTESELALFSSRDAIPAKYYINWGKTEYIRTKMYMLNLSPFKETLFLDCDILWLKKSPQEIFHQFSDNVDITFSNHGVAEWSVWANLDEVKAAYEVASLINLHSEFVYFKKTYETRKFFTLAQQTYNTMKVKTTTFAGAIPDELPFMIAVAKTGMKPHREPYVPIFWKNTQKRTLHAYEIAKDFYGMSMGGSTNTTSEIETYNILSAAAYQQLGLPNAYRWQQKRSFLSERQIF